jgi:hypothetical protein
LTLARADIVRGAAKVFNEIVRPETRLNLFVVGAVAKDTGKVLTRPSGEG